MRRRLGVVVPARDEAHGLAACLASLDTSARVAQLPLEIVVVLDSCRDESGSVVEATSRALPSRVKVVEIEARSVGTARRVGMQSLFDVLGCQDDWVATTDADSTVPAHWFQRQLSYRAAGAGLVVGGVGIASTGGRGSLGARWERQYARKSRHVHGANLSFQRQAYERCGGFVDAPYDEDVALVRAFEQAGERVVWAADLHVVTSARLVGRAPHGFASALSQLARDSTPDSSCGLV